MMLTERNIDNEFISFAAAGRCIPMCKLLKEGANVHAHDDAALYWAAFNGCIDCVRELLIAGANVYSCNDRTLRYTVQRMNDDCVQELCRHTTFDTNVIIELILKLAHTKKFKMISALLTSVKFKQ